MYTRIKFASVKMQKSIAWFDLIFWPPYLRNKQKTWNVNNFSVDVFIFGSKDLHFFPQKLLTKLEIAFRKSNNCETSVTVIAITCYYRWHQLMCYKYLLFTQCIFILTKLSVKKLDILRRLDVQIRYDSVVRFFLVS